MGCQIFFLMGVTPELWLNTCNRPKTTLGSSTIYLHGLLLNFENSFKYFPHCKLPLGRALSLSLVFMKLKGSP